MKKTLSQPCDAALTVPCRTPLPFSPARVSGSVVPSAHPHTHTPAVRRLLPVPHPIVIRKYHPNQHTAIWFTAFMWGVIFVRNQELPMFDGQKIRLFTVSTGGA